MNRRTLYRVLAVVVALAAMSPLLLEVDPIGGIQQIPSHAGTPACQDLRVASAPGFRPLASEASLHH
ncbi:hypothetical protein [Geothrix oryzisoli]|uniref:hypothetical protein n=1 Tax=Geothrix oryzisoli TaxID=2922721 RepID=UPI001FAD4BD6|nr:hypothetical protein [Geothrix oryzisoli]